jgi:phospholipid/cholesterol/gamma-HCH transport system ATP-binding protein
MPKSIELKNVSFAYEGQAVLLRDVSFAVAQGEVFIITGPAGSGKSTLLKICAGLVEPSSGTVIIDGYDFWRLSGKDQNDLRRRMGFDFQDGALIANVSVSGNLALPLKYHESFPPEEIEKLVDGWIEKTELEAYRNLLPAALSAGLKRRASFARAMLCGSKIFFWDAPDQVMDKGYQRLLEAAISELKARDVSSVIAAGDKGYLKQLVDGYINV